MRLNMANNIINLDRKRNRRSRADSAHGMKMERCVLCWHLTNVPENCYYELFKQGVFSGEDNMNT